MCSLNLEYTSSEPPSRRLALKYATMDKASPGHIPSVGELVLPQPYLTLFLIIDVSSPTITSRPHMAKLTTLANPRLFGRILNHLQSPSPLLLPRPSKLFRSPLHPERKHQTNHRGRIPSFPSSPCPPVPVHRRMDRKDLSRVCCALCCAVPYV